MPTTDSKIHLTTTTESPMRNVVDKGHLFATTPPLAEWLCCIRRAGAWRIGQAERLGGCVDLEPPVPMSTGRRLPGFDSLRR
jgi:hypothetical protein